MSAASAAVPPGTLFPATMWSDIVLARDGSPASATAAQRALDRLARAYWQPIYRYLRRRGHGHEDACDLAQGFFAHLLSRDFLRNLRPEGGRFRAFLVRALGRWLNDQHDRRTTLKRRPADGAAPCSLHELAADGIEPAAEAEPPERTFDRQWAREVVARALARLEAAWTEERAALFAALRDSLEGRPEREDYAGIGARLGVSISSLKNAAFALRREFAAAVRAEVRATVAEPGEVEEELRYLVRLLREGAGEMTNDQ